MATGDLEHNNAGYMTDKRFEFRDAGSNCLDGFPDEKWMNFELDGEIGNYCPNEGISQCSYLQTFTYSVRRFSITV